jgi:transposase
MSRFIEEDSRTQTTLFPERLEDFIAEDNPIRVIEAFVNGLDLCDIGFNRATPKQTGRPAYRPATLLKLYIYGYMNRIQSSRRLEQETHRNVELMWLLGRLQPDFKTIASFRKDNGKAIQQCCREFVEICRKLDLFAKSIIAIDGSKFKAVNTKQKNDTQGSLKRSIKRTEQHIARYLAALDDKDDDDPGGSDQREPELKDKLAALNEHLDELKEREKLVKAHPDKQLSETDPDSRLMKQSTVGSLVGYNVQNAVDTAYKLIVAHEVTNKPTDRGQLLPVSMLAKDALVISDELTVLADRGYYKGTDMLACIENGITPLVPKSSTSPTGAAGFYPREAFKYEPENDVYRCPAGEPLKFRGISVEDEKNIKTYFASNPVCRACKLKSKCTKGVHRRVRRWEHEEVLEQIDERLDKMPNAMTIRAQTVEHPFGTLKFWMGARHFLMKRLENVRTEMSLHVLSYNLRRMISIVGVPALIEIVS